MQMLHHYLPQSIIIFILITCILHTHIHKHHYSIHNSSNSSNDSLQIIDLKGSTCKKRSIPKNTLITASFVLLSQFTIYITIFYISCQLNSTILFIHMHTSMVVDFLCRLFTLCVTMELRILFRLASLE